MTSDKDQQAEYTAGDHLHLALEALTRASGERPSRELSLAITQCETAELWLCRDLDVKISQGKLPREQL